VVAGAGAGATRVAPVVRQREPRVGPPREVERRQPTRAPQGRRPPTPPGDRPPHENARLLALLAGIAVVVVIAAVLILSLSGGGSGSVTLQPSFSHNAGTAVQQMQTLVTDNEQ